MPSRGGVHDARSTVLHRGALEHSTGHACPASHAPRTSRPSMSGAGIAGNPVFVVLPGAVLELCRSHGALSATRRFPTPSRGALTPSWTPDKICSEHGGVL